MTTRQQSEIIEDVFTKMVDVKAGRHSSHHSCGGQFYCCTIDARGQWWYLAAPDNHAHERFAAGLEPRGFAVGPAPDTPEEFRSWLETEIAIAKVKGIT